MNATSRSTTTQRLGTLRYRGPLLVFALLSAACDKSPSGLDEVLAVRVTTVQATSDSLGTVLSGVIVPRLESELAFRVSGKVIERPVDAGAQVKARQGLMRLDPTPFQLALAEAQAQLTQAQHFAALLERDVKRNRSLAKSGAISSADFDVMVTDQAQAQARVQAARSRLEQARNHLAYSSLSAPAEAVVVAVRAEIGQVIESGRPVLAVAYAGQREVEINVPEAQVSSITVGMPVSVTLLVSPANVLQGTVREVSPMADPATRTFRVRVDLAEFPSEARLGMTAQVRIQPAMTQPVYELPITALFQQGAQPAVWVLPQQAGQLQLRPVQLASLDTVSIRVSAGLSPGERVVVAGVHRLDEKQKVKVWDERLP